MSKIIRSFAAVYLLIMLISCVSDEPRTSVLNETISDEPRTLVLNETISDEPRTLVLNGFISDEPPLILNEEFIENIGGFTSWYCYDSFHEEKGILLEFGYFNDSNYSRIGFILYDGGCTGELTNYHRKGVDHRWDWGPDNEYSFIINPDGTGLYYDFTGVEKGERIKARGVYKCHKRQ